MQFREERIGNVLVFRLHGKLMGDPETAAACVRFKQVIAEGSRQIVMDFRDVRWINSAGIGTIIACLSTARKLDGDVRFANLGSATKRYFHITKLEMVVKMYDFVDEAVRSFQESEK